jgi:hypothetical protein
MDENCKEGIAGSLHITESHRAKVLATSDK